MDILWYTGIYIYICMYVIDVYIYIYVCVWLAAVHRHMTTFGGTFFTPKHGRAFESCAICALCRCMNTALGSCVLCAAHLTSWWFKRLKSWVDLDHHFTWRWNTPKMWNHQPAMSILVSIFQSSTLEIHSNPKKTCLLVKKALGALNCGDFPTSDTHFSSKATDGKFGFLLLGSYRA